MAWSRRWRIDSREKWSRVLDALRKLGVDFASTPIEIVVREEMVEKTARQRALFHVVADDVGRKLGYFPGEFKREVKRVYFGDAGMSTEDLDHDQYGDLIECAYAIAAHLEIVVIDRRIS